MSEAFHVRVRRRDITVSDVRSRLELAGFEDLNIVADRDGMVFDLQAHAPPDRDPLDDHPVLIDEGHIGPHELRLTAPSSSDGEPSRRLFAALADFRPAIAFGRASDCDLATCSVCDPQSTGTPEGDA